MTQVMPRTRYDDPFLNALTYSHQSTARGEVYQLGVKVADLPLIEGSVSAERQSTVRRTFTGSFDPRLAPTSLTDTVTPYGTEIKVWRGIRYPNSQVEEYPIFFGRIDNVRFSRFTCEVRASDRAANVTDARFEAPRQATKGMTVVNQIKALITEAVPGAEVIDHTGATATITTPATWDRERAVALDNLAASIGAEWFAGADGKFHIDRTPSLSTAPADWVLDAGASGVLVERTASLDRAQVYNAVVVNGEPPDGKPPVYAVARHMDATSPLRWGGPFGKVPRFFSTQFITTTQQASDTAVSMLADVISATQSLEVTCVPNPRLFGQDVVYIHGYSPAFDGMYYIQSFTMPLGPEDAMTMVCSLTLEEQPTQQPVLLRPRPRQLGAGVRWP